MFGMLRSIEVRVRSIEREQLYTRSHSSGGQKAATGALEKDAMPQLEDDDADFMRGITNSMQQFVPGVASYMCVFVCLCV